ncbi:DUF2326 domain-containing protein [Grimontia sp. NTOU-MAR1]|uniref:DUF2326 domain-containing protein n=1 Tax=Grimontia sp. NTOU-MAR1 TaxID=3111011 RepID=UPI002DB9E8A3|nr:DUF2326 domain-containing protein [Grimontia sp. NTOU-MAR1]WRV96533.1 DUF2326 domain-containing protein [Grimontia sp. NTOU-MAR1]
MRLNNLWVYKNNKIIREITFKDGVNLIINEESDSLSSGNSVGKSTLSRLVDYIFLSDGKDIYQAPEFGKLITEIVDFIDNNRIFVRLSVTGFDDREYLFGRFLSRGDSAKLYFIGQDEVGKNEYTKLISEQVFGFIGDKPIIRNLSHKFIRNTHDKMQNTTRFLHTNTKPDIYDQLYLFLFGFQDLHLLKEKGAINRRITTRKKDLSAYRKPNKESALQKMLKPLEEEKEELTKKISNFDFTDSQEKGVKQLVSIQSEISELTVKYSNYETRVSYLIKSIDKLKSNASSVDGKEIYEIYNFAGISLNKKLKRTYQDLMVFHNKVISNKVKLIENDLFKFEELSKSVKSKINALQLSESRVFKEVSKPETLKSIGEIYNNLSLVREKIASVEVLIKKIEDTKNDISSLEKDKEVIVNEIFKNSEILNDNIEVFNSYFGELSKDFYEDRYIFDLNFDLDSEKCEFDIANITPNSTGGKKKGEVSAFDFAYINFVNKKKINRATFIIHDSIEDVDSKQINDIFTEANKLNGQYIVSVLSDKLSNPCFNKYKENDVILELSETNKFFKIR